MYARCNSGTRCNGRTPGLGIAPAVAMAAVAIGTKLVAWLRGTPKEILTPTEAAQHQRELDGLEQASNGGNVAAYLTIRTFAGLADAAEQQYLRDHRNDVIPILTTAGRFSVGCSPYPTCLPLDVFTRRVHIYDEPEAAAALAQFVREYMAAPQGQAIVAATDRALNRTPTAISYTGAAGLDLGGTVGKWILAGVAGWILLDVVRS